MNHSRLKLLLDMLERWEEVFPGVVFDSKSWREGTPSYETGEYIATSMCALGACCMYPPFVAEGLKFSGRLPIYVAAEELMGGGWMAAKEFFGISWQDASECFGVDIGKRELAIRKMRALLGGLHTLEG